MEEERSRPVSPGAVCERHTVSGPVLALVSIVWLGVLTVGNAYVLNVAVGAFHPVWLAAILLLEISAIAGVFVLRPDLRPAVRWELLEIVGMAVVAAVIVIHALHLAPADLMPVSFTVDTPNQHLLIDYIYQNDRFPDGVDYLYIYDDYPVAPSALAAFSARLLGVLPAQTMYPLAALLVAAQVILVYGVIIELLPQRPISHVLATLASLAILLTYQYSIHVFSERFYSNMIMGDLIVLLTLWVVTVRDRLSPILVAGLAVVLVFGCLNSYPAWLPFTIAPILASLTLDRRLAARQRAAVIAIVASLAAVLTLIAVVDQWAFITWFAPVRDRRLLPSWRSLGGPLLLLAGLGLWVLVRTWKERVGFALFVATDLILVVAVYALALWDKLALYIPDKTFYFNVFILAVFVALSLDWLWNRLTAVRPGKPHIAAAMILATGLAVAAFTNWRIPSPDVYPITLSEYRLAYQLAHEIPDAEFAYLVRTSGTFYWIYGSVLNRTYDLEQQTERWRTERPTYDSWIRDATAPNWAIVSDVTSLPADGRWREIIRVGNSAAIEKTP